jgi:hypothetical protein
MKLAFRSFNTIQRKPKDEGVLHSIITYTVLWHITYYKNSGIVLYYYVVLIHSVITVLLVLLHSVFPHYYKTVILGTLYYCVVLIHSVIT